MFDTNNFKRSVKEWVRTNPRGTVADLVDYCEELIPAPQYQAYSWIVDQTVGWYEHVLSQRQSNHRYDDEGDSDQVA